MQSLARFASIALWLLVLGTQGASAQTRPQLSDADRNLARQIEASAIQQLKTPATGGPLATFSTKAITRLRDMPAGKQDKSVIAQVSPILPSQQPGPSRALVIRYDYATGLTFRTVVDLGDKRAVDIKADANFPTPLAEEEGRRASELATGAVPAIGTATSGSTLNMLPILDTLPTSANYGHRLVVVWREGPTPTARVLVDLTRDSVATANY